MTTERKAQPIPEQYLDLFEKRSLGFLATLMPDGSPQVTPLWASYDGEHVLVNAAQGTPKRPQHAGASARGYLHD